MKATGIVRRIDDLGRVVIPKELRKQLNIKEGEPVEIYIDENNNIILTRFRELYRLSVWALSDEDEGGAHINEIKDELSNILMCLRNKYRFTEGETANILNLFEKDGIADFSAELYGLEFYIKKV